MLNRRTSYVIEDIVSSNEKMGLDQSTGVETENYGQIRPILAQNKPFSA